MDVECITKVGSCLCKILVSCVIWSCCRVVVVLVETVCVEEKREANKSTICMIRKGRGVHLLNKNNTKDPPSMVVREGGNVCFANTI